MEGRQISIRTINGSNSQVRKAWLSIDVHVSFCSHEYNAGKPFKFFSSPSGSWQTLILTEERTVLVVPIPFRYRAQTIMKQVASSARGREKKKESKKGTEEKNIYMRED